MPCRYEDHAQSCGAHPPFALLVGEDSSPETIIAQKRLTSVQQERSTQFPPSQERERMTRFEGSDQMGFPEKVVFRPGVDDWVWGSTGEMGGGACRSRGVSARHVGKMGGKLDDIAWVEPLFPRRE